VKQWFGRKTVSIAWQQQPTTQKIVYSVKPAIINRKKEQCLMKDCGKQLDEGEL